ncbi:hypothetical protein VN0347_14250 [Helicobacter pylori]
MYPKKKREGYENFVLLKQGLKLKAKKNKHPFLMGIFSKKKKKTKLERVLFLVFMLFLMKINLKSHLVFKMSLF